VLSDNSEHSISPFTAYDKRPFVNELNEVVFGVKSVHQDAMNDVFFSSRDQEKKLYSTK